jgi:hypothetical protein
MRFERLRRQALTFGEAAGWLSDDDRVHGQLLYGSQRSPKLLSGVRDGTPLGHSAIQRQDSPRESGQHRLIKPLAQ